MLSRRQFVWGAGGATVLLGAGGKAIGNSLWKKPSVKVLVDRTESWAHSICQLCPSGCGVSVRLANGSPVTLRGNPLHPVNRGGVCARGGALLQAYYDPDRITGPVKRDGGLIGGWAPLSWDEALKTVGERLKGATMAGSGRVALLDGGARDISGQLLRRLVRACGSDLIAESVSTGELLTRRAVAAMQGQELRPVYDLANASFLMSLDSGMLEASGDAMNIHRSLAEMRSRGGRVVHAGPRMGIVGSKADTWLPTLPGTAGILALGMAHIILKERLARTKFLAQKVAHFEDYVDETGKTRMGVRGWILREFSPQRVAELTGLEWEQVIRTARQFGSAERPLAVGPTGSSTGFSQFDALAIHTLNAITGAIDVPGGMLFARNAPVSGFEHLGKADPNRRTLSAEDLADRIVQGREKVDVLFIHETDPIFASSQPGLIREALSKVPLVVSTSPFKNDAVQGSHLVLPDLLWLEKDSDSLGVNASGYPVVSMSPAAVRKRTDGRSTTDVVFELAKQAGESVSKHFPWGGYKDVVKTRVGALFALGAGDVFTDVHRSTWSQLLERGGWRLPTYRSAEELGKKIENSGGWWEPAYYHGEARRIFPRVGNKMDVEPVRTAAGPRALQPQEALKDGALYLYVYGALTLDTPLTGSLPYLQDIATAGSERGWNAVAEVNPATAAARGIAHGDRITLTSGEGTIQAVARVTPTIRPDVVAVSAGTGRMSGGRYAKGVGANPYGLIAKQGARLPAEKAPIPPTPVQLNRA